MYGIVVYCYTDSVRLYFHRLEQNTSIETSKASVHKVTLQGEAVLMHQQGEHFANWFSSWFGRDFIQKAILIIGRLGIV